MTGGPHCQADVAEGDGQPLTARWLSEPDQLATAGCVSVSSPSLPCDNMDPSGGGTDPGDTMDPYGDDTNPGGGGYDGGGPWPEFGDEYCGSSNLAVSKHSVSPVAASALARVWKTSTTASHCYTSAIGEVDLDDDIWDVRLHFEGIDNMERTICRSNITYLNLVSLIETEGYGINDKIYYVKEEDRGIAGMALLDSMSKVTAMLDKYEVKKCIKLTVVRAKSELPVGINSPSIEEQVYAVNDVSMLFQSQQSVVDSEYLYLCTQQSNNKNLDEGKKIVSVDKGDNFYVSKNRAANSFGEKSEEYAEASCEDAEDGSEEFNYDRGEYRPEENEKRRREDEAELNEKISSLKKRKAEAMMHEGDSDVEELFAVSDSDSDDCFPLSTLKKLPVKRGPTNRAHCSKASSSLPDYVPSSDEGFQAEENSDDSLSQVQFVLPSGRKSRAKKMKPRMWYDEGRLLPAEQICLKMCFTDVYQFRRALKNMHIAQLRNFTYHRNCKDRIIAQCEQKDCPFFMVASKIAGEKTFCIRKLHIDHCCGPVGENCKVNCRRQERAAPPRAPTTTSAQHAATAPFTAPRRNNNGEQSSTDGRPIRAREKSRRLDGYLTASRIHEKTVEELKKEGR